MSSLKAVFFRELRQMFARPGYPFVAVLGMAFCCLFFLTVMDEGLPQRLPVGIVDHDGSSIARMLKREVDAGQSVRVVAEYASYTDARQAMQRGEIYAFLVIPENLYGDLLSYKRPTLTLYANSAYTLGGTLTYRQLTTMANLVSAAVQREVLRSRGYRDDQIMALIQPIVLDTHAIGNPWVNYSVYLSSTLLPGLLGMIVLMLSAFSMTHELKMRTSPDWLQAAGDHVPTAVLGKMLPYTILFTILGWAMNVLMYKVMHFPLAGSFLFLCLATAAYVVAMQAVAVFVVSWLPTPGLAVSLCALYSTLSLTLSGFSYPVEAMLSPFQALTWLVPLRHYYLITVDQTLLGLPVAKSCLRLAILLAAVLLPLPLSGRLKKAMSDPEFIGD
ncbi:MAG: ABC transporter permease [Bacteroidales bacterium]|nr:ABC transporter permease [Bacteroidales bacterium]